MTHPRLKSSLDKASTASLFNLKHTLFQSLNAHSPSPCIDQECGSYGRIYPEDSQPFKWSLNQATMNLIVIGAMIPKATPSTPHQRPGHSHMCHFRNSDSTKTDTGIRDGD